MPLTLPMVIVDCISKCYPVGAVCAFIAQWLIMVLAEKNS